MAFGHTERWLKPEAINKRRAAAVSLLGLRESF